jgi:hypothetical protein
MAQKVNSFVYTTLRTIEDMRSEDIEAIIKEMQMIADRKYSEEESERELLENIN